MPRVLITPEFYKLPESPRRYHQLLESAGFEVVFPASDVVSCDLSERTDELRNIDAVIAGPEPYPQALLEATSLRAIARHGTDYEAIDLTAATRCNVVVTVTPGADAAAIAEHTMALLLAAAHGLTQRDQQIRQGNWPRNPLPPVRGRTLGLIGLDGVGRAIVPLARALNMRVVVSDPQADEDFAHEHGVGLQEFDELLRGADIISLHASGTRQDAGMLDARAIGRMKRGTILINTARASLIDQEALLEALQQQHLAAALDVFDQEPLGADHPLVGLPNVLLSPHVAGADLESLETMSTLAAESIIYLHAGAWPEGRVANPEIRPNWRWHPAAGPR